MNIQWYTDNENVTSGMTMIDRTLAEQGNMALHACSDPGAVLANRQALADLLHVEPSRFVYSDQTHSDHFYKVTKTDAGRGSGSKEDAIQDMDALYTYERGIVLCAFTADCVPVLFHHPESGVIGVIHSGWQGTVKEITFKLFRHLADTEGCELKGMQVQIGPALSQEKFEVDADVYKKFKQLGYADDYMYFKEKTGKYHIDNQLTVKAQCERAGIPAAQIALDRTCTFKDPAGFSYRQNRSCGRHMAFIMRK